MASTKGVTVLDNNVTLTAGAGNHTSGLATATTDYGGVILIKITNGATGPTVPAQAQIQVSADNSNFYNFGGAFISDSVNSSVNSFIANIPPGIQYIQVVSGSNTAQNVTIRVEYTDLATI